MGENNSHEGRKDGNQCMTRSRRDHAYADNHIYKYEIGMVVFSAIAYSKEGKEKTMWSGLHVVLVYNTFMLSCFFPFCFLSSKRFLFGLTVVRARVEGRGFIRFFLYYKQHTILIFIYGTLFFTPFHRTTWTQAKLLSLFHLALFNHFRFISVFIEWKNYETTRRRHLRYLKHSYPLMTLVFVFVWS